jgi:hypothetical protein
MTFFFLKRDAMWQTIWEEFDQWLTQDWKPKDKQLHYWLNSAHSAKETHKTE